MSLFIFSDLHILDANDPIYRSLLTLLNKRVAQGDTVILAGDIFDLFVGNKSLFRERYSEFFNALSLAGDRGVKIHYIEGNHDFLMRGAFKRLSAVSLHAKELSLQFGNQRIFVAHGDTVDRSDYGYRLLRAFFRSFVMRFFILLCPGSWLDRIGRTSSRYSRENKPILVTDFSLEERERIRCLYRSYAAEKLAQGYDFVALGHCHDLDEMQFLIGDRAGQYINVGFPRLHGSILRWDIGSEKIYREPL